MHADVVDMKPCSLTKLKLQHLKVAGKPEWVINNAALDLLGNDPQELIQCTHPGDKVNFELFGVHKFNRTLEVYQELEFVSKSREEDYRDNELRHVATFTCPDTGPFLRIKYAKQIVFSFV